MRLFWFGLFRAQWRLRCWFVSAAFAALLSGCLFDGIGLPNDYRPWQSGATQPIDDLAIYSAVAPTDPDLTVYVRFIQTTKSGYVMEQYIVDDGEVTGRLAFVTHLVPLGNDWYAMHWKMGSDQAYTLAKLSGGQLITSDLTPLESRIKELGRLADINFHQPKGKITIQDAPSEEKVIELLKVVSSLPQAPEFTLSRIQALPENVKRDSMELVIKIISGLDARIMEDGSMQPHFVRYFLQLHEDGEGWGSYALARLAANGWGVERNYEHARQFATVAIGRGVQQAHSILGYLAYLGLGEAADAEKAIPHLRLAAQAGEARAYTMLGLAYRDGKGVSQDKFDSKAWLGRAVAESQVDAYTNLAVELLKENTAGDDLKAVDLVNKAMAEKNAHAYYLRGWMYAAGRGGSVDQTAATDAYRRAAELGNVDSQRLLGERLIAGLGAQAAPAEGKHWLQRAASSGDAQSLDVARQYGLKPLTPFDRTKTGIDAVYGDEQRDWGVAPEYGYTHAAEAPTPITIPMARVIQTGQLYRFIQQNPQALILDVNYPRPKYSVPRAVSVAGLGGPLSNPDRRRRADAVLNKLTAADKSRPIVFLCASPKCWLSYNAARYAAHTGYQDVIWYRGGLLSWGESKLGFEEPTHMDW